jgi:hypothetical protein
MTLALLPDPPHIHRRFRTDRAGAKLRVGDEPR